MKKGGNVLLWEKKDYHILKEIKILDLLKGPDAYAYMQ